MKIFTTVVLSQRDREGGGKTVDIGGGVIDLLTFPNWMN